MLTEIHVTIQTDPSDMWPPLNMLWFLSVIANTLRIRKRGGLVIEGQAGEPVCSGTEKVKKKLTCLVTLQKIIEKLNGKVGTWF